MNIFEELDDEDIEELQSELMTIKERIKAGDIEIGMTRLDDLIADMEAALI